MRKHFSAVAALVTVIILFSAAFLFAETRQTAPGTITGVIELIGGGPMTGGTVFFFDEGAGPPPSATKYWRVPTQAFPIDKQARFTAVLPEGAYYLGAIQRKSGDDLGPPQEGDYFFISQDAEGRPKKLTVWKGSTTDLGTVAEAAPFRRASLANKGITSVSGTIRDEQGKPREGMVVFAFASPSMFGRPLFVSERSDKNGGYILRVAGSGKYYLRARADYGGGPPASGEFMGVYQKGKPVVTTQGRTLKNVNITLYVVGR